MNNELSLEKIKLPSDVIANSGLGIPLYGELKGDPNEIVVITQLVRRVYEAYVCHMNKGYDRELTGELCIVIEDLPEFENLVVPIHMENTLIQTIDGVHYTMACLMEKDYTVARANWLW